MKAIPLTQGKVALMTNENDTWESRARYSRKDIISILNAIENLLDAIALVNDESYYVPCDLPRARILLNNKAQDMRAALFDLDKAG